MTVQIAVKIAIGGDSAGGCLAAATVLYAKNNNINICSQMLVYPVLDCQMKTQSAKKYTDTPVWNAKLNRKMWQLYLNGNSEVDEYAKMLSLSGCEVELFNTTSTMHGFDMALKSKIVIKSIGKRCDFLRKSFK